MEENKRRTFEAIIAEPRCAPQENLLKFEINQNTKVQREINFLQKILHDQFQKQEEWQLHYDILSTCI